MDRVKGKVAIVTGAGTGIGKASACLLAKEGALIRIPLNDIRKVSAYRVSDILDKIRSVMHGKPRQEEHKVGETTEEVGETGGTGPS